MNLHSLTFWEKSPLLLRQKPAQIDGLARWLNDYLYAQLGTPCLHFYILETLVKACSENLRGVRKPAVIIDVCFSEPMLEILGGMFEINQEKLQSVFLTNFGIWLTEQVSAHLTNEKEIRLPAIYVRCMPARNPVSERNARLVQPHQLFYADRTAHLVFSRLGLHPVKPDFYFLFPRSVSTSKIALQIKSPSLADEFSEFDLAWDSMSFGKQNIIDAGNSTIHEMCPLVADRHVEFSTAIGPYDNITYAWIKHLGKNETWLVSNNQDTGRSKEVWQLATEDAWTFVRTGTHIVLGRAARLQAPGMDERLFLAGSMVITVEY